MSRFQPALLGGLFVGVLSTLPIIGSCCCLWMVCGGVLATYLLQQRTPMPIATSEAAIQGLVAGLVGGVIFIAGQAAMTSVFGPAALEQMREAMSSNPEIPGNVRDMILNFMTGTNLILIMVFVWVPVFAILTMAGSLLGVAFFRKKLPPQAQV